VEKVIITLRAADADEEWCTRLRRQVAADLLETGAPGLAINVRDDAVRKSLMTLTTLEPPVVGFVTLWTQQSYGDQVRAALARLDQECDDVAAYLVTESVPRPLRANHQWQSPCHSIRVGQPHPLIRWFLGPSFR
jgi:hypothetical protein